MALTDDVRELQRDFALMRETQAVLLWRVKFMERVGILIAGAMTTALVTLVVQNGLSPLFGG